MRRATRPITVYSRSMPRGKGQEAKIRLSSGADLRRPRMAVAVGMPAIMARDTAGDDVLAGEPEAVNFRARREPVFAETLRVVVEAIEFAALPLAEMRARKRRGDLVVIHPSLQLRKLVVEIRHQALAEPGLEGVVIVATLAPGLVLPFVEPLVRRRCDDLDGRGARATTRVVQVLGRRERDIDDGKRRVAIVEEALGGGVVIVAGVDPEIGFWPPEFLRRALEPDVDAEVRDAGCYARQQLVVTGAPDHGGFEQALEGIENAGRRNDAGAVDARAVVHLDAARDAVLDDDAPDARVGEDFPAALLYLRDDGVGDLPAAADG